MRGRIEVSVQSNFESKEHLENTMYLLHALVAEWTKARFGSGRDTEIWSRETPPYGDFVLYAKGEGGNLGSYQTLEEAMKHKSFGPIRCSHIINRKTGETVHTF